MSPNGIPGINMESALALYDGDEEIFRSVLESYSTNTPDALEKLRDISRQAVTAEGLRDYTINVHGIKSVSATVAAEAIVEKAKKLETEAKELLSGEKIVDDFSEIQAENENLIKDIEILVGNILHWLKM